jgi:hypothetical protein
MGASESERTMRTGCQRASEPASIISHIVRQLRIAERGLHLFERPRPHLHFVSLATSAAVPAQARERASSHRVHQLLIPRPGPSLVVAKRVLERNNTTTKIP